jgi:hypothetical protein
VRSARAREEKARGAGAQLLELGLPAALPTDGDGVSGAGAGEPRDVVALLLLARSEVLRRRAKDAQSVPPRVGLGDYHEP